MQKRTAKTHQLYGTTSRILQVQQRCATQTEPTYGPGCSQARVHGLWPAAIQPHVALVCRFMVSTSVIHGVMEGWGGLVGWPIVDSLPTKWSPVSRGSGTGQGRSAGQRPTSYPLSHVTNQFYARTANVPVVFEFKNLSFKSTLNLARRAWTVFLFNENMLTLPGFFRVPTLHKKSWILSFYYAGPVKSWNWKLVLKKSWVWLVSSWTTMELVSFSFLFPSDYIRISDSVLN